MLKKFKVNVSELSTVRGGGARDTFIQNPVTCESWEDCHYDTNNNGKYDAGECIDMYPCMA